MVMLRGHDSDDDEGLEFEPPPQKFTFRKPICPYVCSTPCDFVDERNFLATEIFPKLHEICLQRATAFSPIDIQWAPDGLQTETGHLLRVCLDLITKCSPYFLCLLGETYGPYRDPEGGKLPENLNSLSEDASWLDKNYLVAASAGYRWILKDVHQNCSVPELEIIQAAFLGDNRFCHFYYRQPEHLDNICEGLSEEEIADAYKLHKPENEYADLNIRDLKQRIVNKGLPVKYFRTKEELGAHVLADWQEIIDTLYPPLLDGPISCETEEYREWLHHEVFCESRRQVYINHADIRALQSEMSTFCAAVLDEPLFEYEDVTPRYRSYSISTVLRKQPDEGHTKKSILVVKGDKGTGKSALVANWIRKFTAEYPEVKVITHFVGSSGRSWDVTTFMRRCIVELQEEYLRDDNIANDGHETVYQSFKELSSSFLAALSLGPCVLILDGVNELGASLGLSPQEVKTFSWVPVPLPNQCRLVFTTTHSDFSHTSLFQRPDVKILALSNINTTKLKAEYLEDYMQMYYSHLNRFHLQTIFESKLSGRPLFLKVLGQDMTGFSVYHDLDTYTEMIREMCMSIRDLYMKCLRRWSQDHSWSYEVLSAEQTEGNNGDFIGWVPDMLRLLAVSRSGLTANEILDMLEVIGYQENVKVTYFDWLMFRLCLGDNLTESPYGLYNFSHQHLKEVVEYILLRTVKASTAEIMSKSDVEKEWKKQKSEFHQRLIAYFKCQPISQRRTEELPWQQLMAGDMTTLVETLSNPDMFLSLYDVEGTNPSNYTDLRLYWHYLEREGHSPVHTYMSLLGTLGVVTQPSADKMEVVSADGSLTDGSDIGMDSQSEPGPTQIMLFTPSKPDVPRILTTKPSAHKLSVIEEASDVWSKDGKSVVEEELTEDPDSVFITQPQAMEVTYDLTATQVTSLTWYIAQFLLQLGHTAATETILLALSTRLLKSYPLSEQDQLTQAKVEECLGQLYLDRHDLDLTEKWYKKALRTVMDMFDIEDTSPVYKELQELKGKVLQQIGYLRLEEGLLEDAEDLLEEALDVAEVTCKLTARATVLYHIGNLRMKQQDYLMSETNLRKCLLLRQKWYGKSHPLVADVLYSLGNLMAEEDNVKGYNRMSAEDAYRRCLEIREHHLEKDHVHVANVLFQLGKLLKNETSYAGKAECQRLLRRSLDIRITQLGGDHIETRSVRQYLNNLEANLKGSRNYDSRSSERPYSSLSWRGNDLANMEKRSRLQSGKSSTYAQSSRPGSIMSRTGSHFSHAGSQALSRPVSGQLESPPGIMGQKTSSVYIPASERLLMESSKPRLLHRESMDRKLKGKGSSPALSPHLSPHAGTHSPDDQKQQLSIEINMHETTEQNADILDSFCDENDKTAVKFRQSPKLTSNHVDEPVGRETPPQRLYRRYGSPQTMDTARSGESVLGRVGDVYYGKLGEPLMRKNSTTKPKRPVGSARSARSAGSSHYTTASAMSMASTKSHKSTCDIPHGPHSIHISNARTTTMGPHSSVNSLLGEPGRRDISKGIHHKSAWYHVPGRYSTAKSKIPPKRSQVTESAKTLKKKIPATERDPYVSFMRSDYRKNNPNNPQASYIGKGGHSCSKGQAIPPYPRYDKKQYVVCDQCRVEAEEILAENERELVNVVQEAGIEGEVTLAPTVNGLSPPDRPRQVSYMLEEPMSPYEMDYMQPHSGPVVTFNDAVVMN